MKLSNLLFPLIVVALAAAALPTVAEDKCCDGWKVLFNGKDLTGWEQHSGKAVYKVEDGVIAGHSVPNTGNSFLCTKDEYKDFELVFETKVVPALNSGVQIRSRLKGNDRIYGPQVEVEVGPGEAGYIYGEATGRGWLSQDRSKKITLHTNQWNKYRVVAKGDNIKTWVNGEPVADLTDEQSNHAGVIGLQVHGVGKREDPLYAWWRNIKIRELD